MKHPCALVTLIWVYLTLPSFFLKALCTRLLLLNLLFNLLLTQYFYPFFQDYSTYTERRSVSETAIEFALNSIFSIHFSKTIVHTLREDQPSRLLLNLLLTHYFYPFFQDYITYTERRSASETAIEFALSSIFSIHFSRTIVRTLRGVQPLRLLLNFLLYYYFYPFFQDYSMYTERRSASETAIEFALNLFFYSFFQDYSTYTERRLASETAIEFALNALFLSIFPGL